MAKQILIPLPDVDFDVTEVAVPWHMLRAAGHELVFATERGDMTVNAGDVVHLRAVEE